MTLLSSGIIQLGYAAKVRVVVDVDVADVDVAKSPGLDDRK